MRKVIFFDVAAYEKEFLIENCEGKFDYKLISYSINDNFEPSDEMKKAEVISCFTLSKITEKTLKKFPHLKLIALRSVGFNHIDIKYCQKLGIFVVNTPNYGNKSVAEFAFGLLLDVTRKISRSYIDLQKQNVNTATSVGFELFDKTIGIIGLGAIGEEMAKLSFGFGMKILGFDIYQKEHLIEKYGVQYVPFEELLKMSDVISLHAPLTKDNFHLIDENAFNLMKKNCVLINTARGELIDTQALYNVLNEKRIKGAGLDVLECEETLSNPEYLDDIDRLTNDYLKSTLLNSRILNLENVVITPHIAYDTQEAIDRILNTTIDNIESYLKGIVQNNIY